jgi:hypothetical protein
MNYYKCGKYYFVLLIFILLISPKIYGQGSVSKKLMRTIDTTRDYKMIHPVLFGNFQNISVEEDSLLFNGYLVYKIYKNPNKGIYRTNEEYFICDVFWIFDLKDIEREDKKYFLITPNMSNDIYIYDREDTDTSYNFVNFKNFYSAYRNSINNDSLVVPFLRKSLTTRIFHNNYFWKYQKEDSIGYFIFKNSFIAYYITSDLEYGDYSFSSDY